MSPPLYKLKGIHQNSIGNSGTTARDTLNRASSAVVKRGPNHWKWLALWRMLCLCQQESEQSPVPWYPQTPHHCGSLESLGLISVHVKHGKNCTVSSCPSSPETFIPIYTALHVVSFQPSHLLKFLCALWHSRLINSKIYN